MSDHVVEELVDFHLHVSVVICINIHFDDRSLNVAHDVLELLFLLSDFGSNLREVGDHELNFLVGVFAKLCNVLAVEDFKKTANSILGFSRLFLNVGRDS